MSVETYLLPITEDELASILAAPDTVHRVVDNHEADVCSLSYYAPAIMFTIAEDAHDPLLFLEQGGPPSLSDWVGKYVVEDGQVVECEVDMGYGPASYYKNRFLVEVARRLEPWIAERFTENCDLGRLEEQSVYPLGWNDRGRREDLVEAFKAFRACVTSAANTGRHLLVWNA